MSGSTPVRGSQPLSWLSRLLNRVRSRRPITVGVDLMLMQPGGANGGVKPLVYSFLSEIARTRGQAFRFIVYATPELAPELQPLLRPSDQLITPAQASPATSLPTVGSAEVGQLSAPDSQLWTLSSELTVVYAPFGRSPLIRPGLPTVSLIVDLLHRDLPDALPIEEVNYRHEWFGQIASQATFFQCISHYTASRLQHHYGVAAERCFVTHIPAHERLDAAADTAASAASPVPGPFVLYPANFWPHKNHETLLAAYAHYQQTAAAPWPLVLTGHRDARMETLATHATRLGIASHVHFLGHLDDAAFVALWRAAGALVYPSLHEGFGIPLLEAMHFGCPIIAANATALPEVGGDACLYVDPRNPTAIADALACIAGDAALRADLVRRGRQRLRAFSLEREAARLADHFARAARRRI